MLHCTEVHSLSGEISFTIQHPDLESSLLAPVDALTVEFKAVSCSIALSEASDSPTSDQRSRKRQKHDQRKSRPSKGRRKRNPAADEYYDCLTTEDQKAVDDFIMDLNPNQVEVSKDEQIEARRSTSAKSSKPINLSDDLRSLLEISLKIMVTGNYRRCNNLSVCHSVPTQALILLIPTVFYIPYVKVHAMLPLDSTKSMID